MDRIRKALDLAREERDGVTGAGETLRAFEPKVVVPNVVVPNVVVPISTSVAYTRTRLFSPATGLLESNRIVGASSLDAAAGAFRMLRTQVLQRLKEHSWKSFAVLSPGSDDGKTTT